MSTSWFLESDAADGSRPSHAIHTLPFRVGRDPGAELSINARGLSRQHAELRADASGGLRLHDLDSTNGTWVNRERVQRVRMLAEGDLIHFGNAAYRLTRAPRLADTAPGGGLHGLLYDLLCSEGPATTAQPVVQAIVQPVVQAIVQADGGELHAYELRARRTDPAPGEAARQQGGSFVAPHLHGARLFIDTQPEQMFSEPFFTRLQALRALAIPPRLVVQVHGAAAVQVQRMRALAARLATLDVQLAHTHFGADRAHLNALGDLPPHYVKFAGSLVHGLHEAPASRQKQVRDLVKLVLDLDAVPLATGVALKAEAALCRELGFQLLQGQLTGAPVPADWLQAAPPLPAEPTAPAA